MTAGRSRDRLFFHLKDCFWDSQCHCNVKENGRLQVHVLRDFWAAINRGSAYPANRFPVGWILCLEVPIAGSATRGEIMTDLSRHESGSSMSKVSKPWSD
jgi:hypothetical protein